MPNRQLVAEEPQQDIVSVAAPRANADAAQQQPAVAISGLRKTYGSFVALQGLTLDVRAGEVFGFLGPNGAGKTTTVKLLMGLVKPTAGSAQLLGRPLGDRNAKRRIGFLPELFRFHDWLSAEELLDFHGKLYRMSARERRQRIPEVLELVGLAGRHKQPLRTFSKGMQQRAGLAQALLNDPKLIFLDEPTSALDPLGRREVRDIIRHLRDEGRTVFLNSHLLSEVETVCDRVAIVNRGRLAAIGTLADLLNRPLIVDLRLGGWPEPAEDAVNRLARILAIEYMPDGRTHIALEAGDEETVARVVDALSATGVAVYGVTPRRQSLEDAFVEIVRDAEPGGQP